MDEQVRGNSELRQKNQRKGQQFEDPGRADQQRAKEAATRI